MLETGGSDLYDGFLVYEAMGHAQNIPGMFVWVKLIIYK